MLAVLTMLFASMLACMACSALGEKSTSWLQSSAVVESSKPLAWRDVDRSLHNGKHAKDPSGQSKALEMLFLALSSAAAYNFPGSAAHVPVVNPKRFCRQSFPRLCYDNEIDFSEMIDQSIREYYENRGPSVADPQEWYSAQCEAEPPSGQDELMNYGMYTDPLHPAAASHPQAHMANMYCQLVDGFNITGLRVLEVGSGRGGGARILQQYHQPAVYVGLDLISSQVASANERLATFGPSSLTFVQGNACDIPFPNNTFDVVINVESSHNYNPFISFLEEVRRVLVPDGKFLIEDFRDTAQSLTEMQQQIEDVFGTDVQVTNITSNVQTSLDMNQEYIEERIQQCMKFADRRECEGYWLGGGRMPTFMWKVQLHKPS